jgi:hypothetical protein
LKNFGRICDAQNADDFLEIVDANRAHYLHRSAPTKVGHALGDWAENDPFDISIDYF